MLFLKKHSYIASAIFCLFLYQCEYIKESMFFYLVSLIITLHMAYYLPHFKMERLGSMQIEKKYSLWMLPQILLLINSEYISKIEESSAKKYKKIFQMNYICKIRYLCLTEK